MYRFPLYQIGMPTVPTNTPPTAANTPAPAPPSNIIVLLVKAAFTPVAPAITGTLKLLPIHMELLGTTVAAIVIAD